MRTLLLAVFALAQPLQAQSPATITCNASACTVTVPVVHDTVLKPVHDTVFLPAKVVPPAPGPAPTPAPSPTPTPAPIASALVALPGEHLAALPLVYLNTTEPVQSGTIYNVAAGGDLQLALNTAQPGDVIELAAGAKFTGNFRLPSKTGTGWIVIRPTNWRTLPAAGQRMTPAIAAQLQLPVIASPNSQPVIQPAAAAHHFRLVGIEVTTAISGNFGLIATDAIGGQTTLAQVPHDLVFDRMYIHGTQANTLRRCVALNSASTAVIDSDLRECHDPGQDSQAIATWNGPGPFKIVNNYLEGATENVIFGGADPSIPNLTPSDIEIRGNHIAKPIAFKGVWSVKNLLEIKHAQRVLVEGNILDGSWVAGQTGFAVVLKTVNQNGTCTWCVTQDVTFRYNIIRNVGEGFNIAASPDNAFQDTHAQRLTIHDNLITGINVAPFTGGGHGFQLLSDLADVVIAHNTVLSPTQSAINFGLGPNGVTVRTSYRDNVSGGGQYGVIGDNVGIGRAPILKFMPDGVFTNNAIALTFGSSGFPAGSFYPPSLTALQLGADFSVAAASPFHNAATDGRDLGADIRTIVARTSAVVVP